MRAVFVGLGVGLVLWTLTEYWVHRTLMHRRAGANPWSAEHLDHHARPFRTAELRFDALLWWKVAGFAVVTLLTGAVAVPVDGWRDGSTLAVVAGLAFTAGYATYTNTHHRVHHVAPRGPYSRWVRAHHLAHHFGTPKAGFGVTTGLWDTVFRTQGAPLPVIAVPRRLAPPWLVGADGAVRPEHAHRYLLR